MSEYWIEEDGRIQRQMKLTLNKPKKGWNDRHIKTPNHFEEVAVIYQDGTEGKSKLWCMDKRFAEGGKFIYSSEHGNVEYWREL